jgi:hypothetical protein
MLNFVKYLDYLRKWMLLAIGGHLACTLGHSAGAFFLETRSLETCCIPSSEKLEGFEINEFVPATWVM